jgi:hypothetical protein
MFNDEQYDKQYDPVLLDIQKHVVPVFRIGTVKRKYEYSGCATYLKIKDKYYLATASHVIDQDNLAKNIIPLNREELISIPRKVLKISHNEADVDISLICLAEQLEFFSPIELISDSIVNRSENIIVLLGYPQSKVSILSNATDLEPFYMSTKIIDFPSQPVEKAHQKIHFFCRFQKKKVLRGDGSRCTVPNPNGMSGGPAIELSSNGSSGFTSKLIGIMTDWDKKNESYIRCSMAHLINLAPQL